MLIRISLIVAVVAALVVGALNIAVVKNKITTLTNDRNDQRAAKVQAQTELASTKKNLAKTQADLTQTQQQLTATQTERDKAKAEAAAETKRADGLSAKLATTTKERDDARNNLAAYQATGFTAEQVGAMSKSLKTAQEQIEAINEEKVVLQHAIARYKTRLAYYEGTNTVVKLPAGLEGKILIVDPKWEFVVVNVGEDQGVLQNGELLVSRGGKLVAKIVVRSVEKNISIANVMPGWQLGEIFEGDEVTPAHPAS
ncbi:MAG: hypothetical protein ACREFE_00690 [Limisphaerales bacterium]